LVGLLAKNITDTEWQLGLSANAQAMMNIFATVVVSWTWLKQVIAAEQSLEGADSDDAKQFYQGKIRAAKYYYAWELPLLARDFAIISDNDLTCATTSPDWL
jgi:butyryl-CoA dehydrogenase